jgi:hypothetical protein
MYSSNVFTNFYYFYHHIKLFYISYFENIPTYIINICLLVSRFELWSPRRQFIVIVNQLSFEIITYIVKTKEMKFHSWFFFKNLHMQSKINISNFKSFEGKDIWMSFFYNNSRHISSQKNDLMTWFVIIFLIMNFEIYIYIYIWKIIYG